MVDFSAWMGVALEVPLVWTAAVAVVERPPLDGRASMRIRELFRD